MPIYLFQLVAGLREKNAKGYPVKKARLASFIFPPRALQSDDLVG